MTRQIPMRQRIRKALVLLAFLSFPITMNFFSPYVIIDGAMNGTINGSLINTASYKNDLTQQASVVPGFLTKKDLHTRSGLAGYAKKSAQAKPRIFPHGYDRSF